MKFEDRPTVSELKFVALTAQEKGRKFTLTADMTDPSMNKFWVIFSCVLTANTGRATRSDYDFLAVRTDCSRYEYVVDAGQRDERVQFIPNSRRYGYSCVSRYRLNLTDLEIIRTAIKEALAVM